MDYFSPTLYVTDLLVLFLMLLEIPKIKLGKLGRLGILGIFAGINIYFSLSPAVSIYKWLKVFEFGFLVWWISHFKFQISNFKFLLIPIFYESVLAIWQYFNQGSIGGLWYWLGERAFNAATPGIAHGRPYGTFPHPNVLAGFLIVSGPLVLKYFPRIYRIITVAIIGLVFFLTLSRGNLIDGWHLRQQLNNIAIQQFNNSPLIGTGLGTSPLYQTLNHEFRIMNYALRFQPPHNIYVLVLSETGIIGLLGFCFLIYKTIKRSSLIHNSLFIILVLGFFDHYFLTLQQGQLLFALALGLLTSHY
ncbi:O-antigen ligase family protein [Candidatus Gottesmanbacteria bacterium]|nr:O-antigen ligase family protein [Candidatus Gottesmanbacteria bacterium]